MSLNEKNVDENNTRRRYGRKATLAQVSILVVDTFLYYFEDGIINNNFIDFSDSGWEFFIDWIGHGIINAHTSHPGVV